jgi:hypothetical protein
MEYVLIPRDLYEKLRALLTGPTPATLIMGVDMAEPMSTWQQQKEDLDKQALRGPTDGESHEVFPHSPDDVHGSTQVVNKREQTIRQAERSASEIIAKALADAEAREKAAGLGGDT